MSVWGQVSHLSWGSGQVTPAWSGGGTSRRLMMISHYELRAVLSTWLISNSTFHQCRQRTVRHTSTLGATSEKCQRVSQRSLNALFKGFQHPTKSVFAFACTVLICIDFYNVAASEIRFHTHRHVNPCMRICNDSQVLHWHRLKAFRHLAICRCEGTYRRQWNNAWRSAWAALLSPLRRFGLMLKRPKFKQGRKCSFKSLHAKATGTCCFPTESETFLRIFSRIKSCA